MLEHEFKKKIALNVILFYITYNIIYCMIEVLSFSYHIGI